jgi:hypothetical protein
MSKQKTKDQEDMTARARETYLTKVLSESTPQMEIPH